MNRSLNLRRTTPKDMDLWMNPGMSPYLATKSPHNTTQEVRSVVFFVPHLHWPSVINSHMAEHTHDETQTPPKANTCTVLGENGSTKYTYEEHRSFKTGVEHPNAVCHIWRDRTTGDCFLEGVLQYSKPVSVATTPTNGNLTPSARDRGARTTTRRKTQFLEGLCAFLTGWVPRETAVLLSSNQSGHKMGLNVNGSMQEWRYKVQLAKKKACLAVALAS